MNVQTSGIADQVRAFFPGIVKLPLSGPEGMRSPHYGLFRSDTSEGFGPAVSQQFVPHSSEDIVALVEATESVFGEAAKVDLGFHGGHYVAVTPTDDLRREICDRDGVWPRLVIQARYGEAFRATMGVYRDACRNLSRMKSVAGTSVVIRHTSGLREKMNELLADFGSLQGSWDTLVNQMQLMARTPVQLAAFLDQMYPQTESMTDRAVTIHRSRTEAIIRRIMRERTALGNTNTNLHEVSAWEAWQGIQGYVQHDKTRKGNPGTFDRVILALDDSAVTKAESILLSMAL
jgi:hypothetical protein